MSDTEEMDDIPCSQPISVYKPETEDIESVEPETNPETTEKTPESVDSAELLQGMDPEDQPMDVSTTTADTEPTASTSTASAAEPKVKYRRDDFPPPDPLPEPDPGQMHNILLRENRDFEQTLTSLVSNSSIPFF